MTHPRQYADARVAALLLEFSALQASQAADFLDGVNEYLYVAHPTRRQFVKLWRTAASTLKDGTKVDDGAPPSADVARNPLDSKQYGSAPHKTQNST